MHIQADTCEQTNVFLGCSHWIREPHACIPVLAFVSTHPFLVFHTNIHVGMCVNFCLCIWACYVPGLVVKMPKFPIHYDGCDRSESKAMDTCMMLEYMQVRRATCRSKVHVYILRHRIVEMRMFMCVCVCLSL